MRTSNKENQSRPTGRMDTCTGAPPSPSRQRENLAVTDSMDLDSRMHPQVSSEIAPITAPCLNPADANLLLAPPRAADTDCLSAGAEDTLPCHTRQVSWDRKVGAMERMLASQQQQQHVDVRLPSTMQDGTIPKQGRATTVEMNARDFGFWLTSHKESVAPVLQPGSSTLKLLHLEDVLQQTPYEAEAETYILKVMEQRYPTPRVTTTRSSQYNNDDAAGTSLLSHVPPDVSPHTFSNAEEDYNDDDDDDDDDEITTTVQETPAGSDHNSEDTLAATSMHLSSSHDNQTERTSSVRDTSSSQARPNQTLEQTLFGLTSALEAMHTQADTPHYPANAWEDAAGKDTRNTSTTHHQRTGSSAEQLTANASLLFQRKKNDAPTPDDDDRSSVYVGRDDKLSLEESVVVLTTTSSNTAGRWNTVCSADKGSHIHKKTGSDGLLALPPVVEETPERDEELGGKKAEPADVPEGDENTTEKPQGKKLKRSRMFAAHIKKECAHIKEEWEYFNRIHFRNPLTLSIYAYCKVVLLYFIIPAVAIAAILFNLAGNPPTGYYDVHGIASGNSFDNESTIDVRSSKASASWWLLFLGARQVITFSLAMGTELILIDFLSLRVRGTLRLLGPWITLLIVQSKGWPFLIFAWGLYDFCLLYGDHTFYEHWLYWQEVDMFTEKNPAGDVVFSDTNRRILLVAVSVGLVVAIKRLWLALFLGKQTFGELDRLSVLRSSETIELMSFHVYLFLFSRSAIRGETCWCNEEDTTDN
jgi:hypothetical protein